MARAAASGTRRDELVAAAIEAIEEEGPSVGLARIAERAGVLRPNVYRLFASKDELDDAVIRIAGSALVDEIRPTLMRSGTPVEIVSGVIGASVAWAAEHPNLYRFMAARRQTRSLHRARVGRTRFLGEVVKAATAYLRSEDIEHDVPDGVLAGLMGMVDASIIWWLDHADEQQDEVVARLTRQVVLILRDLLGQLGFEVSEDRVLDPAPFAPGPSVLVEPAP